MVGNGKTIDPHDVVAALAAHEEALAQLYEVYAVKFPPARQFWMDLSDEEHGHASLIRDLGAHEEDHSVLVDADRFQLGSLREDRRRVEDETAVAESASLSLAEALAIAYDFEQAVVEQRAYQTFGGDTANVQKVLNHLRESSKRHRDQIYAELERVRKG